MLTTLDAITPAETNIVEKAMGILERLLKNKTEEFCHAAYVKKYCRLKIGHYTQEVFAVAFLDQKNRLISFEEIYRGTINAATISTREIAKRALELNAVSVVLSHNHPSGDTTPSRADIDATQKIKRALNLFEIDVLDHIIVSNNDSFSFSQNDLISS